jgi:ethanolamine permease
LWRGSGATQSRIGELPGGREDYFGRRKLRRHAAFWSLWSLGVAAVISGDFYGWNLGLDAGGFGGLLIATVIITVMYYGLCYSIAEMSPALPHTGGAYSFARSAMGPWGGFITGLAENMEYVITPAVVVGAMGFLMHDIVVGLFDIVGSPWWNSPVTWWAVFYVVFVWINIIGIEATMRFTVVINILALGILAFFFISVLASGKLDTSLWTNIPPDAGGSSFLPTGSRGSSRPSRSPSGSTWPSRSCRWPPRSRTTPSVTSPGPPSGA